MLVKENDGLQNSGFAIYISRHLEDFVSEHHREYISEMIVDFSSRSNLNMEQILADAKNFSVGPLRIGYRGRCEEKDLPQLLRGIFNRSGYLQII